MIKVMRYLALTFVAGLISFVATAQVTIKGNVKNASNSESVGSVNVEVKGTSKGTYTDASGNFSISVPSLPVTLVVRLRNQRSCSY
jgi:CarboxypepD_reg-like domain